MYRSNLTRLGCQLYVLAVVKELSKEQDKLCTIVEVKNVSNSITPIASNLGLNEVFSILVNRLVNYKYHLTTIEV